MTDKTPDVYEPSTVADTILAQLGGNRFIAMTGAKDFVAAGDNRLMFRLPARLATKGINKVVIQLEPTDLYTVAFYKIRGANVTIIDEYQEVYWESLRDIFTEATGLSTSL